MKKSQDDNECDEIFDMLDEDRSDHIELHELKASRKMLQELAESASAQVMHSAQQCFFRGKCFILFFHPFWILETV